ncbi:hypothetical protein lbkm_1276 [Lachnospiraceae bacterium KM106-2]|nr:hypothetical protein lbkm_1276 [Lachnospiraceae bacterium KM106-2]
MKVVEGNRMKRSHRIMSCAVVILILIVGIYWSSRSQIVAEIHNDLEKGGPIASSVGFNVDSSGDYEMSIKAKGTSKDITITLKNKKYTVTSISVMRNGSWKYALKKGDYELLVDSKKFQGKIDVVIKKR